MNIIQSIARKLNRKCPLIHPWTCAATAVLCLLITSCSGDSPIDDSHTDTPDNTPNMAVTFDSYTTSTTRATDETSYLQTNGFGVFAYYTEAKEWKATTDPTPNFMYNQLVEWSSDNSYWTYTPVKYWPNDNTPADNLGATGSQTHSYLSFFAYAPYTNVDVSDGTAVAKPTTGITALTSNTAAGDPKVTYTAPTSPDLSTAVDLMWGTATDYQSDYIYSDWTTTAGKPLTDLFKPSVQQTVKFKFQHALAQMRVKIQAEDYIYPANDELGDETRILVNSITIGGLGPESGVLNLDNTNANTPLWENVSGTTTTAHDIKLTNISTKSDGTNLMNDEIRNTYTTDASNTTIATQYSGLTATAFEASTFPKGVTKTAKPVYNITDGTTESDWAYLFIPANATDATKSLNTLDVSVDYDIITRDDALKNSTIPGFTILKNNYSGTLTLSGDETFKAGHKYTLNIILGVHSIQFTVEAVDEWGNEETITPQTSN